MICLGLSTMGSSSACIFRDGKLLFAVEEERLSRIKNDASFPVLSIKECLLRTNISIKEVNYICIYWQPYRFIGRSFSFAKKIITSPYFLKFYLKRIYSSIFSKSNISKYSDFNGRWMDLFIIKKLINKNIGYFSGKIKFIDHHLSHQFYCEVLSSKNRSINLSFDGGGENYSTKITYIENEKIKTLKNLKWPNSLGHFYSYFTGFLGFKMLEGEYKMMGLAPYGEANYLDLILNKILILKSNGEYLFNHKICDYHLALEGKYSKSIKNIFFQNRKENEKILKKHLDLAASVQAAFELALENMIKWSKKKYPDVNILNLSGGCALNVTANGKIYSKGIFNEINVTPASNDAGCSIGSVVKFLKNQDIKLDTISIKNPYLGGSFENNEIENTFKKLNLTIPDLIPTDELIEKVSSELAKKKIVAWFQGSSEFGPRALGNRSFLADPREDNIREILNKKIKKRELFRPFAPSILDFKLKEFYELDTESPYMSIVSKIKTDKKKLIPAVIHIDETSRIHSVSKNMNLKFYNLLNAFYKKTNVPVLLNTSFNIQEPIVYSPLDALNTYFNSNVDYLCIGNYLCDIKWKELNRKNKI
tara:strand:- start:1074 stop:2849 length:1776 start_codon:yes stop_codon:yes gene_type:complete